MSQAKQPCSQPATKYRSGQEGTRAMRRGVAMVSSTIRCLANEAHFSSHLPFTVHHFLLTLVMVSLPFFEIIIGIWNSNVPHAYFLVIGCSWEKEERICILVRIEAVFKITTQNVPFIIKELRVTMWIQPHWAEEGESWEGHGPKVALRHKEEGGREEKNTSVVKN